MKSSRKEKENNRRAQEENAFIKFVIQKEEHAFIGEVWHLSDEDDD